MRRKPSHNVYDSEIDRLPQTYRDSIALDGDRFANCVAELNNPLIAVGSGGSLIAARVATQLHEEYKGQLARSLTPMELRPALEATREVDVLLISGRGKNTDIVEAMNACLQNEPLNLAVLCADIDTPLARRASQFELARVFDFKLAPVTDGFLATNSLVACCVLLARAYGVGKDGKSLPPSLDDLLSHNGRFDGFRTQLKDVAQRIWSRDTLIALHDPITLPGAIDLESRFSEAALGHVQISDFRNFAHGRHFWLSKRGNTTAVIAFVSDRFRSIALKTLKLLPANVPQITIDISQRGFAGGLVAILSSMMLVAETARAHGIDPARPGVPGFGRVMYRMSARSDGRSPAPACRQRHVAIERKARARVKVLRLSGELDFWTVAYHEFVQRLQRESFEAMVLDYDGTLCNSDLRLSGVPGEIAAQLVSLLENGLVVGIATGRGGSVWEELRSKIPERHWEQVVVGYYNGAQSSTLAQDMPCTKSRPVSSELASAHQIILGDEALAAKYEISARATQISLRFRWLSEQVERDHWLETKIRTFRTLRVVRSCHSFDILPNTTRKTDVVQVVSQMIGPAAAVLAIGDRGDMGGNDHELLASPYSLSVHLVSQDPSTCWNLAPPGFRGTQAALWYLKRIVKTKRGMRFRLAR